MALAQVYHDVAAVIGWDRSIEFGMKVWESKPIPKKEAAESIHGGGVGFIYIPTRLTRFAGRELVRLAGRDDAERLVKALGGERLAFPCIVAASIARRNRAIAKQVADGWRVAVVACAFDLTERRVRQIFKQESLHHVD